MAHEVEASHQQNKVCEQKPMPFNSDLAFPDEYASNGVATVGCARIAKPLALLEGFGLGKHETENDDEDWGAGAKPEERTPAVGGRTDEGAGEGCGEKVAEGVLFTCQHDNAERFG
jgi:hypothetical protein